MTQSTQPRFNRGEPFLHQGKPRNIWHLFIAVVGTSVLGWYINNLTPDNWYTKAGFVFLVWITTFFTSLYIFNARHRALFISTLITGIVVLRILGLKDATYVMLLMLSLILLYVYFTKK